MSPDSTDDDAAREPVGCDDSSSADGAVSAKRTDGGLTYDGDSNYDDEGDGGDDGFALDIDLPEDSLFTLEDYLQMYEIASKEPAFEILNALSENDRLSASELTELTGREGNDLHYHLRKLKRKALIKNRRDPNTGTEETYSYYTLTDLGNTVLTHGVKTGVQKLAAQEAEIAAKYTS